MKSKKIVLSIICLLLLAGIGYWSWNKWASPTRIALVNFPTFQSSNIALSNEDNFVKYEDVPLDQMDKLRNYDFILTWAMGLKISEEQRSKFVEISKKSSDTFFCCYFA